MSDSKTIPEGWVETTLGEVVEITSSKRIFAEEYKTFWVPFYRWKEIIEKFKWWEISTELYITEEKYSEIENKFGAPKPWDMLLTSVGTIWVPYIVREDERFYFKDWNLTWFKKFNNVSNNFLYYWIVSSMWQYEIQKRKIGSTQEALTIVWLKSVPIVLPPLPEQQAIAQMLSSFDDKIELLREQNETLEKTAQTIFQEWFGKYGVDDELPEGWRVGKVKDFVDTLSGFAFKSDDFSDNGKFRLITIANVQDGSFVENTKDGLVEIPWKMPDYCHLKTGDILLSLTGNVWRICHVIGMDYLLNQRVAKLKAKNKNDFWFVYLFFRQPSLLTTLINISVWTAQQNLSPIKTAEIEAIIADENTMKLIWENINPMIEKILSNLLQIQSLSKTRDELLPRLMNGEVRVEV